MVIFFSILTMIFGSTFLSNFGFGVTNGDNLTTAPLCHQIDFGIDECRLAGTFSTPNHFAGYLILILPILLTGIHKSVNESKLNLNFYIYTILSILNLVFIYLSVARYAYLAVFTITIVSTIYILDLKTKYKYNSIAKIVSLFILSIPFLISFIPIMYGIYTRNPNLPNLDSLPTEISKPSSSTEHYRNTMASVDILRENNSILLFGTGLGNSGPAAKSEYQNLIEENYLIKNYRRITYDWYIIPYRISIPENWYIQLILNGGIVYSILYIAILFVTLKPLYKYFQSKRIDFYDLQISLTFFGIIIGNLYLHIWENQTIAIYWSIIWIIYKLKEKVGVSCVYPIHDWNK